MRARMISAAAVAVSLLVVSCPSAVAQTIALDQAIKEVTVEVEITGVGGSTGDAIQLAVQRKVPETLRLTLTPGTLFKSKTGDVQNMLGTSIKGERLGETTYRPTTQIVLTDNDNHTYIIEAYCLDFHKGNPGPSDSFTLSPPDERATSIVEAGKKESASIQAIQAALWMDRENVSSAELKQRFPVGDGDIEVARRLVQSVGKAEEAEKKPGQEPSTREEAQIKVGDTVIVSRDGTKLMLGSKVLARLPKGTKLEVAKVKTNWIGGQVDLAGKKETGWISRSELHSIQLRIVTKEKSLKITDFMLFETQVFVTKWYEDFSPQGYQRAYFKPAHPTATFLVIRVNIGPADEPPLKFLTANKLILANSEMGKREAIAIDFTIDPKVPISQLKQKWIQAQKMRGVFSLGEKKGDMLPIDVVFKIRSDVGDNLYTLVVEPKCPFGKRV